MPPSPSDARQTDPQTIRFPFDANFNGLLEHYFDEFLSKHDHYSDDKIVDIIGKTLRKMSPIGPRPDKIRVILRRVGTGNVTFWSVMRGSKILPDGRQRLAPENLEAD